MAANIDCLVYIYDVPHDESTRNDVGLVFYSERKTALCAWSIQNQIMANRNIVKYAYDTWCYACYKSSISLTVIVVVHIDDTLACEVRICIPDEQQLLSN